jgi:hypothetical protein
MHLVYQAKMKPSLFQASPDDNRRSYKAYIQVLNIVINITAPIRTVSTRARPVAAVAELESLFWRMGLGCLSGQQIAFRYF